MRKPATRIVLCLIGGLMAACLVGAEEDQLSEAEPAEAIGQWVQVVEGGFGDIERLMVNAMAEFHGDLYAAAFHPVSGGEIWRSADGEQWEPIVGPGAGVGSGFNNPRNQQVTILAPIGDWLFAGIWNTEQGAELWRSRDGLAWEPVIGGTSAIPSGFGKSDTGVIALVQFREQLFVGTGSREKNNAELWRSQDAGATWEPVAGERVAIRLALGSQSRYLQDLTVFHEALYAAVGNPEQGAEIWRTRDGWTWEPVVGAPTAHAAGLGTPSWDMIFAMEVFGDRLYAAVTSFQGEAEGVLWRSADGETWVAIQPDVQSDASAIAYGYGDIVTIGDALYISSTPHGGSAPQVWMSADGERWQRITSEEQFATANAIPVLFGFRGDLYVGTFSFSRGEFATKAGAAIWRFTPPSATPAVSSDPSRGR